MFVRVPGRWRRGWTRPFKIRSFKRPRFAFTLHLSAPVPLAKQVLKHVGDVPDLVPVLGRDFEERETELVAEFDAFEMRDHAVLAVEIILVADEHAGYLRRLEDVLDGAFAVDDGLEAIAIGDGVDEKKGVAPDRVPATMTKIVLRGKDVNMLTLMESSSMYETEIARRKEERGTEERPRRGRHIQEEGDE